MDMQVGMGRIQNSRIMLEGSEYKKRELLRQEQSLDAIGRVYLWPVSTIMLAKIRGVH